MPDALPRVSVIVPVHDGVGTIRTCVEALCALDYPHGKREIVVVDNRSTDGTRDVVARYPVRLVEEREVQCSYAARNRGVSVATGTILAFTDADCVPDRGWLRALVRPFVVAGVGGVAGAIEAYAAASVVERYQARRAIRADRAFAHPVRPFAQTANVAYPRALVEALGGFDATLPFGGDLDFSWRMQRVTGRQLVFEPGALVRHRHRTTWRGLLALYEKNAIANCLLAERYAHYASYPELRTLAYGVRECLRSGVRGCRGAPRPDGGDPREHFADAVRFAGEIRGWLRWHAGRVRLPRVAPSYPLDARNTGVAGSAKSDAPRVGAPRMESGYAGARAHAAPTGGLR
jgi:cellulose synthase/poly-beta-1,6-N-acetylglucosamine synthase-like glycosyltransferase